MQQGGLVSVLDPRHLHAGKNIHTEPHHSDQTNAGNNFHDKSNSNELG
jgi:hypothetical protein